LRDIAALDRGAILSSLVRAGTLSCVVDALLTDIKFERCTSQIFLSLGRVMNRSALRPRIILVGDAIVMTMSLDGAVGNRGHDITPSNSRGRRKFFSVRRSMLLVACGNSAIHTSALAGVRVDI